MNLFAKPAVNATAIALSVSGLLSWSPSQAATVSFADLLDGTVESIESEDLVFSNFTFGPSLGSLGTIPVSIANLGSVMVSDLATASADFPVGATVSPGPGLRWEDTGNLFELSGTDTILFDFSYDIVVMTPGNTMTGTTLQTFPGVDATYSGGATISISASDGGAFPAIFLDGAQISYGEGAFYMDKTNVTVTQTISLSALGGSLDLNAWEQRFVEKSVGVVPLPAALPMFAAAMGLFGLVGGTRRLSHQS